MAALNNKDKAELEEMWKRIQTKIKDGTFSVEDLKKLVDGYRNPDTKNMFIDFLKDKEEMSPAHRIFLIHPSLLEYLEEKWDKLEIEMANFQSHSQEALELPTKSSLENLELFRTIYHDRKSDIRKGLLELLPEGVGVGDVEVIINFFIDKIENTKDPFLAEGNKMEGKAAKKFWDRQRQLVSTTFSFEKAIQLSSDPQKFFKDDIQDNKNLIIPLSADLPLPGTTGGRKRRKKKSRKSKKRRKSMKKRSRYRKSRKRKSRRKRRKSRKTKRRR